MSSRLHGSDKSAQILAKRYADHTFEDENGEEYSPSNFGDFATYMRHKKAKLQNRNALLRSLPENQDKAQIFRGVVATVNGYTNPSLQDLTEMVVTHGGIFVQYMDSKTAVTHIIASALTPKKMVEFARYKVVKPAWVVECIKEGKLLPWERWRVISEGSRQAKLGFTSSQLGTPGSPGGVGLVTQRPRRMVASYKDVITPGRVTPGPPSERTIGRGSVRPSLSVSSSKRPTPVTRSSPETPKMASPSMKPESIRSPITSTIKRSSQPSSTRYPSPPLPPPPSKKLKLSSASTSAEASATLLANPRTHFATALNPDFLKQYYQESRLHHLSAWKAELKQKLQELTQASSNNKAPKSKGKPPRRYILHVDFDCFFAAISARNHPSDLTGKPVVVTHGKGGEKNVSSEIASCNYKSREFGVKNGMWMGRALELCPDIVCIPYDFPAYEEASREFYSVVLMLGADAVQSVSVDEVLVDVTSLCCTAGEGSVDMEQAHANVLGTTIRDRVREKTRCEVSVGIGGNILLAKLALRKAKPAGQYHLKPEEVLDFLGGLGLRDLPGVGHSLAGRLSEELKITTVSQLRVTSRERLRTVVGSKTGEKLWSFAHGIDHAEVGNVPERKSVGADVSWGVRFETQAQAEEFLHNLVVELHRRLVEAKVKGKQVTVKIMKRAKDAPIVTPKFLGHGECDVFTKSIALGMATWDQGVLAREAIAALRGYRFPPVELRGFGLQMSKLEKAKIGEESAGGQKTLEFKPAPAPMAVKRENEMQEPAAASDAHPTKTQPVAGPWAFMPPPPVSRPESSKPLFRSRAGVAAPPASSQFLVPSASQIDPSVLNALPDLIPPSASQIDPEFLASLTPDLREEILSEYRSTAAEPLLPPPKGGGVVSPRKSKGKGKERQTLLLQSPRKATERTRITYTPIPRHFPTDPSSGPAPPPPPQPKLPPNLPSGLDPTVLLSLPPDILSEVLSHHRTTNAPTPKLHFTRPPAPPNPLHPPPSTRCLLLPHPPRPLKPPHLQHVSTLPQLRELISSWMQEDRNSDGNGGFEGPNEEDVDVLVRYLRDVVILERDMGKASAVVRWFREVVAEAGEEMKAGKEWNGKGIEGLREWRRAVVRAATEGVGGGCRERGVPEVGFEFPWEWE
ncbi:DNA damage repair protein Mus42 [Tirmania nivea]|nr:DNA damage repair protein Mus42 [Tirmania nivea]